ncbi:type III pantothenate kinase [Gallaecimonas sp. GXIMD1310]|uniref:type III pantothenate kinase n=1 Tax=Gallaecimonas sp. GXIMD1310 TaxID=3131926 RepID=UPI003253BF3E
MKTLLIEAGNTRVKGAWLDNGEVIDLGTLQLPELLDGLPPGRALLASVAGSAKNEALQSTLHRFGWQVQPVVSEKQRFGVSSSYQFPEKLGVDRWLAMLAAYQQTAGACLVVDIGTAATADLLSDNGQHLGGWIAPGLALMQQSVLTHTARVGDVAASCAIDFASDTGAALTQGCQAMLRGFIHEAEKLALQQLGKACPVLLSGGSGELLAVQQSAWQHRPLLVLEGLALYASA